MTRPELPVLLDDEIDEIWMAEALGHPGAIASMTRASIGTGQVGENVRYEITWREPQDDRPASVVAKLPSLDELSRQTAAATGAYVREVGFYRDLQADLTISTPYLHHLGDDLEANRFVLVMSDIRDADQGDQLAGCDREQADLAVTALAGLHGPMWGRDLSAEFDWIGVRDEERATATNDLVAMVVPGFRERYNARLDAKVMETVAWTVDNYLSWFSSFETPQTLIHGDYRLDNMLFARAGASSTAPLTVVDWQTAAMGHGPADAAYFVGAGLLPDDRRQHEASFIETYHEALVASGVDVAHDVIRRDYARGSVSGLVMAIIASQIVGQTDRGDEMFCVMAERHAAQMDDLNVADLID